MRYSFNRLVNPPAAAACCSDFPIARSCVSDVQLWTPRLQPGGVMAGADYPWFTHGLPMVQHGSLFCSFTSHPVGTSCSHRPGSGASRVCVDESTSILKVMTIAPAPMAWCEQCDICCRSWGKRTQKWEATYHNWNGCSSVKLKHLNFNISVQDVCSIYLNILDTCFGHTKPKKRNEFQILILPLPAV